MRLSCYSYCYHFLFYILQNRNISYLLKFIHCYIVVFLYNVVLHVTTFLSVWYYVIMVSCYYARMLLCYYAIQAILALRVCLCYCIIVGLDGLYV